MDDHVRNRLRPSDDGAPDGRLNRLTTPQYQHRPVDRPARQASKPMFSKSLAYKAPTAPAPKPKTQFKAPKQDKKAEKNFKKWSFIALFVLIIVSLAGAGYYLRFIKSPTALPKKLVKSVSFTVYYPNKLPANLKYQIGSAENQSGLLTYKLSDGTNSVVINEQTKPAGYFDLSALPHFQPIGVTYGLASIGNSGGKLSIIYITQSTLINMTATNDIARNDMINLAQSLTAVKK